MDDCVRKGSPQDRYKDSGARIEPCRICGQVLLLRDDEEADCGAHLNGPARNARDIEA